LIRELGRPVNTPRPPGSDRPKEFVHQLVDKRGLIMARAAKAISLTVYTVGASIAVVLAGLALFAPDQPIYPDSMLGLTWREEAFLGLAVGALPMVLAGWAAHRFGAPAHRRRDLIPLLLPGFVCAACALFLVGLLALGYIHIFLNR
jgi:hypothetical protein